MAGERAGESRNRQQVVTDRAVICWGLGAGRFPCTLLSFAHLSKRCNRNLTVRAQPGQTPKVNTGRVCEAVGPGHSTVLGSDPVPH